MGNRMEERKYTVKLTAKKMGENCPARQIQATVPCRA